MSDTTMIYVTHDQVEAMTLADRIVVLNYGVVEQVGTPMELYHRPDNLFVARFIGSPAMNIVSATIALDRFAGHRAARERQRRSVYAEVPPTYLDAKATFGVRPEDLVPADGPGLFTGTVSIVEKLGEVTLVLSRHRPARPDHRQDRWRCRHHQGETLTVTAPAERLHLFDENGNAFRRVRFATAAE